MTTPEETFTEFRVVGEGREGKQTIRCDESLAYATSRAREVAKGSPLIRPWKNVRIESRTVTYSPWKEVSE